MHVPDNKKNNQLTSNISKDLWLKKGRDAIIRLCQLYSKYVCGDEFKNSFLHTKNKDGEKIDVSSRLSLSAFIDIDHLGANAGMVSRMYEYSPKLEGADVLKLKLFSFHDAYILDILLGYDMYLKDLAINCDDICPVCLDDYLRDEYHRHLLEAAVDMLDEQYKVFERALYDEGIEAMRSHNSDILYAVERFIDAFEYNSDVLSADTIDAIALLTCADRMIPAIVNWSSGRDVVLAVKTDSFLDMFFEFCRHIKGVE